MVDETEVNLVYGLAVMMAAMLAVLMVSKKVVLMVACSELTKAESKAESLDAI